MRLGQADIKTQVQEAVQRAISGEIVRLGGQVAPAAPAATGPSPVVLLPILTSLPILLLGGGLVWWLSRPQRRRSHR